MVDRSPTKKPARKSAKARKKSPPSSTAAQPDAADLALLAHVCDPIKLEEISYESWENCHDDLDLRVPLWIPADAPAGMREVTFSRTLSLAKPPTRERASVFIEIPPSPQDGHEIRVAGKGDVAPGKHPGSPRRGDLVVVLRLRRSP